MHKGVAVTRRVAAPPEAVFAAWTQPALLERWAVDAAANDPRLGGRFRHETRAADGLHVVSGEYRELVPNRRLLMTWNHEGPASAPDKTEALITVDLREAGRAATELTVTEEPVPPTSATMPTQHGLEHWPPSKHSWPTPPARRENLRTEGPQDLTARLLTNGEGPAPADRGDGLAASGGSANAIMFPSGSGTFTWRTPFEYVPIGSCLMRSAATPSLGGTFSPPHVVV